MCASTDTGKKEFLKCIHAFLLNPNDHIYSIQQFVAANQNLKVLLFAELAKIKYYDLFEKYLLILQGYKIITNKDTKTNLLNWKITWDIIRQQGSLLLTRLYHFTILKYDNDKKLNFTNTEVLAEEQKELMEFEKCHQMKAEFYINIIKQNKTWTAHTSLMLHMLWWLSIISVDEEKKYGKQWIDERTEEKVRLEQEAKNVEECKEIMAKKFVDLTVTEILLLRKQDCEFEDFFDHFLNSQQQKQRTKQTKIYK